MFGPSTNELKSCAIFIAIRSSAGWWPRLNSGAGAVFVVTYAERWVRCGFMTRTSW